MGARKLAMFDPEGDGAGNPPPFRSDTVTVAGILDWYREQVRGKNHPDVEIERTRIFRVFIAAYGKLRSVDAKPHNLQAFLDARLAGKSRWTIKRWNSTIQRPFNHAARLGIIVANPFKGVRNRAKLSYRITSLRADEFHSSIRHDTHCV